MIFGVKFHKFGGILPILGVKFQKFISSLQKLKKQTVFSLKTAEVWSTSFATDVCRCGPQTADVLPLKKQTAPKIRQLSF
ncbi:hypothetical protein Hanom_Chr04g00303771 [Helianthus anomalus]